MGRAAGKFRLALALLAVACTFSGQATPSAAPTPSPTPSPTPRRSPVDDNVTQLIAEVAGGESAAGSQLDVLWSSVFADLTGEGIQPYAAPTALIPYYTGEVPPGSCSSGTAARFWNENAFYCGKDQSILYHEDWLRDYDARVGDSAPTAILAHEWGHHVQRLLGVSGIPAQVELQADCFAGMFLANSLAVEAGFGEWDNQIREMLTTFFEIADEHYQESTWFQAGAHGSSQQRIRAFGTGSVASLRSDVYPAPVGKGIATCYGYRDFVPRDFGQISPEYRVLNLPGRIEETVGDAYIIQPEIRLGFPTSAVQLQWFRGGPDEIGAAVAAAFPRITRTGDPNDISGNVAPGVGNFTLFQQEGANGDVLREGLMAIVIPRVATGAMVILVYRDGAIVADNEHDLLQIGAEQVATLFEILTRLCGPDDSADIDALNMKLTCREDQ